MRIRLKLPPEIPICDLLSLTPLCASRREAREFVTSGHIYVEGKPVGVDEVLQIQEGQTLTIRRGRTTTCQVEVVAPFEEKHEPD